MKLSTIKAMDERREQGAWVDNIPNLGQVRLRVRGIGNSDYRRLLNKLNRKRRGDATLDDQDEMVTECLIETVLLDWTGVLAEDGAALPFSKAAAREFLQYSFVRDAVISAASSVTEDDSESQEDALKNSSSASAGA
jgi:hypothetical protein